MTLLSPFSLTRTDLEALGPPSDVAYLYRKIFRVSEWSEAGPVVGKAAREFFSARFDFALPEIVEARTSEDGATKLLLRFADGRTVEAVHMPRAVKNPRVTLCLSSQVGCAMGCTFCHTATMGLVRNLSAAEIVGQVLAILRAFGPSDPGRVTLVFMGMGEPLHNVEEVLRAVEVMAEQGGLGISPQRVTVSTSGLVPGIERLARAAVRPCLALSVNATTDEARQRTMPVAKKYSLAALHAALSRFSPRPHEKLTFEYVLLRGENDSQEDAARLAAFARPFRHVVNVIPYNAFEGSSFESSSEDAIQAFVRRLQEGGCLVTVRRSRGRDVGAACGQLARPTGRARRRLPIAT